MKNLKRWACTGFISAVLTASAFAEAEVYIGSTSGLNQLEYGLKDNIQEYDTFRGMVLGGAYYWEYNESLDWGVDFMTTSQGYQTEYSSAISTTSLSLAGRYTRPLNPNFDVFLGAGAGAARFNFTSIIPGVQAETYGAVAHGEIGIAYPYDGVTWFGALRYQTAVQELAADDYRANYNSLSLIGGIQF